MSEQTPAIDFENLPSPTEGFLVTLFITVRSVARSRAFYSEVLGGKVVLEENPCMVKLANFSEKLVGRCVLCARGGLSLTASG